MKVTEIKETFSCSVEFDNGESYERYSEDDWSQRMGDSLEILYMGTEHLEEAYQEYIKANREPLDKLEPIELNGVVYYPAGYSKPDQNLKALFTADDALARQESVVRKRIAQRKSKED